MTLYDYLITHHKDKMVEKKISTDRMGYTSSEDDGFNQALSQYNQLLKSIELPELDEGKVEDCLRNADAVITNKDMAAKALKQSYEKGELTKWLT